MKPLKLKRYVSLFTFLALLFFNSSLTEGLYLEQISPNCLKNTRIAYFPGSFDPLHLGHMTVVKDVLDNDLADYVLVYALPDSDHSKNRTRHSIRLSMLHRLYEKHPKVLITKLMPADMQDLLAPLFPNIKFSVVVGSDIVKTYIKTSQYDDIWMKGVPIRKTHPEQVSTSTGAIMAIPADQVIAFNRDGDDLSFLNETYKNRPVIILTTNTNMDLSSTDARQAVKEQRASYEMVPPEVQEIIEENGLYKD